MSNASTNGERVVRRIQLRLKLCALLAVLRQALNVRTQIVAVRLCVVPVLIAQLEYAVLVAHTLVNPEVQRLCDACVQTCGELRRRQFHNVVSAKAILRSAALHTGFRLSFPIELIVCLRKSLDRAPKLAPYAVILRLRLCNALLRRARPLRERRIVFLKRHAACARDQHIRLQRSIRNA